MPPPGVLGNLPLRELDNGLPLTPGNQIGLCEQDYHLRGMLEHFAQEPQVLLAQRLIRADGHKRPAHLGQPVHGRLRVVGENAPEARGVNEAYSPVGLQRPEFHFHQRHPLFILGIALFRDILGKFGHRNFLGVAGKPPDDRPVPRAIPDPCYYRGGRKDVHGHNLAADKKVQKRAFSGLELPEHGDFHDSAPPQCLGTGGDPRRQVVELKRFTELRQLRNAC